MVYTCKAKKKWIYTVKLGNVNAANHETKKVVVICIAVTQK